jgi:hypothetical protein
MCDAEEDAMNHEIAGLGAVTAGVVLLLFVTFISSPAYAVTRILQNQSPSSQVTIEVRTGNFANCDQNAVLGTFAVAPLSSVGPFEVDGNELCYRQPGDVWHIISPVDPRTTFPING